MPLREIPKPDGAGNLICVKFQSGKTQLFGGTKDALLKLSEGTLVQLISGETDTIQEVVASCADSDVRGVE